jgi:hypothetical protein
MITGHSPVTGHWSLIWSLIAKPGPVELFSLRKVVVNAARLRRITTGVSMRRIISFSRVAAAAATIAIVSAMSIAQAQTGGASGSQAQGQQQPSPQGGTGPITTGSGGTPPNSPQGETPPNMQATSPGSKDAPTGK